MDKLHSKINLKHGYRIIFEDNGTLSIRIETEDDILNFDGVKGNLMDASDFESCLSEHEPMNLTLHEYKIYAYEFLKDWGVDKEAIEAIVRDLEPWLEQYAISEDEKKKKTIADIERGIDCRKDVLEDLTHKVEEDNKLLIDLIKRIESENENIANLKRWIESNERLIAEIKASL